MKNYFKLIQMSLLMVALVFLASCSNEKSQLTATPSDAGFVMVVNGKALKEKGNIKSISETKMYQKMLSEISEEDMQEFKQFEYLFKNTEESGIAINDEFNLFVTMVAGEPEVGFNFLVLDKAKVDALFNKVTEKEKDINVVSDGDVSYISSKEGLIAWDDKQLLALAQEDLESDALLDKAKTLLKQTASESISSNSNYSDFYAKRKDLSIWFNYDLFLDNMAPAQQMIISSQLPFSMKGTYLYGFISFEKGQVVAEYQSVMNDEMKSFIKNYQFINNDFDTDVLKMLPKTSFANLEISINLLDYYHMFIDMYKEKQVNTDMYTAQAEQELGMSIDDLLKSFSGEMAVSMHGINMKEKTNMSFEIGDDGQYKMVEKKSMQPDVLYSSVIKFNDDKLWNILEKRAGEMNLQKQDGYYSIPQAGVNIGYVNNTMLITNDVDLMKTVLADGSIDPNMKSTDVASYLAKYPAYLEINMNLNDYPDDVKAYVEKQGKEDSEELFKLLSTYKRLQIIPTDIYSAKIILQLNDDSKNSLDVILHNLDEGTALLSKN